MLLISGDTFFSWYHILRALWLFSVINFDIAVHFLHCILLCMVNLNFAGKLKIMYKIMCWILHILNIQWLIRTVTFSECEIQHAYLMLCVQNSQPFPLRLPELQWVSQGSCELPFYVTSVIVTWIKMYFTYLAETDFLMKLLFIIFLSFPFYMRWQTKKKLFHLYQSFLPSSFFPF